MIFNVIAKILLSEKFEIEGQKFVKIEGFINNLGIFTQTVREELVPDSIEGKEVCLSLGLGTDAYKKFKLKVNSISLDTSLVNNSDVDKIPY